MILMKQMSGFDKVSSLLTNERQFPK